MLEQKRRFLASALAAALLSGCGGDRGMTRVKSGAESGHYVFHRDTPSVSFIKGAPPFKTKLTLIDAGTKKKIELHLEDVSFTGPHAFFFDKGLAAAAGTALSGAGAEQKMFFIDLAKGTLLRSFPLSDRAELVDFQRPEWSKEGFTVMQESGTLLVRPIDLDSLEMGETRVIGAFLSGQPIFLRRSPRALFLAMELGGKQHLLLYDLKEFKVLADVGLENSAEGVTLDRDETRACFVQDVLGEKTSQVMVFDLKDFSVTEAQRVKDGVETLTWAGDRIVAVGMNRDLSDEPRRYWLHPRTFYVIDPGRKTIDRSGPWTEREGKLLGFLDGDDELVYAVTDNDSPAIWFIRDDPGTLAAVRRRI